VGGKKQKLTRNPDNRMYSGETFPHFPHFHTTKNIKGGEFKLKITRNPDNRVYPGEGETSPHLPHFHTNKNNWGEENKKFICNPDNRMYLGETSPHLLHFHTNKIKGKKQTHLQVSSNARVSK